MISPWKPRAHTLGALLMLAASAHAVELTLCSNFNTADTDRNTSIYQTNGLCRDFCLQDFAFAITQDNACWCSNYAPDEDTEQDLGRCDTTCPAFPSEFCGGDGLFGYIALENHVPSGTEGPDVSTTTQMSSTTQEVSSTSISTSTSSLSSQTSQDSSSQTSTSESPPPTSIQTVTNGGVVTTVTVIPTTSDPSEGNTGISEGNDGDGKLGTGAIAGIAVGVVGAVAIAAGAAAFWFFKRRKRNQDDDYQDDPSVRGSSSGQVGSANPEMAMAGGSQASPNSNSNRNSTLQIDPRMDPFQQGLYIRPTGSHESINTLRDDHDYSRRIQQPKVLRATNPDANPDD